MATKSHTMNVEFHSGTELPSGAKLQIEAEVHSDSKISVHEMNVDLPDREVHSDSEVDRPIDESIAEPRLSKYVKRHHPTKQIIGDKDARPMTRNRLRSYKFFLRMHEPKTDKYALEKEDQSKSMKE